MKSTQIFFSDQESIVQDKKNQIANLNDIDSLIDSILSSEQIQKNVKQTQIQAKIEDQGQKNIIFQVFPLVKIEQEVIKYQDLFNRQENFDTEIPQHSGKRQRKKDQNTCKKLHKIANKCLRRLGIYNHLKVKNKKTHNKNYFVFVLIVANKTNLLKQFMIQYREAITQELKINESSLTIIKSQSRQYKKIKCFIEDVHSSLCAMEQFKKGDIKSSLVKLYDVKNIKTKNCISKAYSQIVEFNKTIQIK